MKITKLNDINAKVKSNTELLNNIFKRLDTEDAASINVRAIERDLDILQERAPLDLPENLQEQSLRELMEKHPELNRKSRKCLLKRVIAIAGIAAVLAVIFTAAAGASRPGTAVTVYDDKVIVGSGQGVSNLPPDEFITSDGDYDAEASRLYYSSMREALEANGMADALDMTWIPEDFDLYSSCVNITSNDIRAEAKYKLNDSIIDYCVIKFDRGPAEDVLADYDNCLGYVEVGGVTFEIQQGYNELVAQAISGNYVYSVHAAVTYEELSLMLQSLK